jgi:hypothetical protein
MSQDRWRTAIRPAVLAMLPWLFLTTAVPACSPSARPPGRSAGGTDRLEKMRALRGTGDPRRKAMRPSAPPRQETGLR